jgi:hypothetical protein
MEVLLVLASVLREQEASRLVLLMEALLVLASVVREGMGDLGIVEWAGLEAEEETMLV